MKITTMIAIPALGLALAACGSNFEWFPKTDDTTGPAVKATIAGNTLFNNHTTHISSLAANNTVTFSANELATIYYTTSGSEPTTASPSVEITSTAGVAGPTITVTDTILKFFGIDKAAKKNQSATQTSYIKSP